MSSVASHGAVLLEHAYDALDLAEGRLLAATTDPAASGADDWRRLGDWLILASRASASHVFFVGDDPVVVFSTLPDGADDAAVVQAYRRAWSLGRPRCLFLATESDLRVFALTTPPHGKDAPGQLEPLEVVRRVADVASTLEQFHRDRLESGAAFETGEMSRSEGRADQQLIRDVRVATSELAVAGLSRVTAHALIERVILVRYLEDRGVLTREYFQDIARRNKRWRRIVDMPADPTALGPASVFASCLVDRAFAYAIFERLARDFNGDLFLPAKTEREVNEGHLLHVKSLLEGSASATQEPLFLWAYDFSVVPTSLISAMYEMFHQQERADDYSGTYYTPPELVEFVLAQALTPSVLESAPRVCDPACGSGIFTVEAYRLIVRHEAARAGRRLRPAELRHLLLDRIAGIDIDEQAVRLAAFSLYLAFLNYQTPQDITHAGPLPRLITTPDENAPLVVADAFAPTLDEREALENARPPAQAVTDGAMTLPWRSQQFDVVVGNPPWTEPAAGVETRRPDRWARRHKRAVGDRNLSQLFLWRSLSLLKPGGIGALLVGAGTFHNTRSTSRAFRQQWLEQVDLERVVNFSEARRVFFSGGTAPFFLVCFRTRRAEAATTRRFVYQTIRNSRALSTTASMAFAHRDQRMVDQTSLEARDYLWKVYAWGSHHDEALLIRLEHQSRLRAFLPAAPLPGYGFQLGEERPSPTLRRVPILRTFEPWGPLDDDWVEPPPRGVKRQPDERLYEGQRLLVSRGVRAGFGPVARLEHGPAAFRHTIYGISLHDVEDWQAKVLLGALLSSVGRYWLFMHSASWGVWYDQVTADDILSIPIPPMDATATTDVAEAVDELLDAPRASGRIADAWYGVDETPGGRELTRALHRIDAAVVAAFELLPAEKDLVADFWNVTHNRRAATARVARGSGGGYSSGLLENYVDAFLEEWNARLPENATLVPQVIYDRDVPVLCTVFETRRADQGVRSAHPRADESEHWRTVLKRLDTSMSQPLWANRLFTLGAVRAVTDTQIIIVKRDERRLWTASAAREDAEATFVQAVALEA